MRGLKTLLGTTALLAGLALAPMANAQIVISIGIPPVCPWGYYDYAPYACAPMGFYGPGYFYNGIFLGMGPWAGWGYGHGWGSHRFVADGGGRYHGGGGAIANRSSYARSGGQGARAGRVAPTHSNPAVYHAVAARPSAVQAPASHASAPRSAPAGGGGNASTQRSAPAGGGGHASTQRSAPAGGGGHASAQRSAPAGGGEHASAQRSAPAGGGERK